MKLTAFAVTALVAGATVAAAAATTTVDGQASPALGARRTGRGRTQRCGGARFGRSNREQGRQEEGVGDPDSDSAAGDARADSDSAAGVAGASVAGKQDY